VQVIGPGAVGRFGTAVVPLRERCRTGLAARNLVVHVSQMGLTGSRSQPAAIPCDGTWHSVRVEVSSTTGAPFVPGMAKVTARLTVHNPTTGTIRKAGTDSRFIRLLAPAEIELGTAPVRLGSAGVVRVPVRFRCQVPWLVAELSARVTQDYGAITGATFLTDDTRLVCDATWHRLIVRVVPSGTGTFFTGQALVDLVIDVQDPVDFDPVDQATFSQVIAIVDDE
jgi:hypothetical protein